MIRRKQRERWRRDGGGIPVPKEELGRELGQEGDQQQSQQPPLPPSSTGGNPDEPDNPFLANLATKATNPLLRTSPGKRPGATTASNLPYSPGAPSEDPDIIAKLRFESKGGPVHDVESVRGKVPIGAKFGAASTSPSTDTLQQQQPEAGAAGASDDEAKGRRQ